MNLKKWWESTFKIISEERAKEIGLIHHRNIHGDEINMANCRSIWKDKEEKYYYRVETLYRQ